MCYFLLLRLKYIDSGFSPADMLIFPGSFCTMSTTFSNSSKFLQLTRYGFVSFCCSVGLCKSNSSSLVIAIWIPNTISRKSNKARNYKLELYKLLACQRCSAEKNCVISGFHHGVNEISRFPGVLRSVYWCLITCFLNVGPISCAETSVTNNGYILCNIQQERRSHVKDCQMILWAKISRISINFA